ncbi:MAG TPA: carboxypeptidase-like regulatory domain-containing protein, partial [Bryobacteraceae bacterium]|nr:carboxypeptidase-like regulatory domain-containing protein [Bryobacteraceae bacterium]
MRLPLAIAITLVGTVLPMPAQLPKTGSITGVVVDDKSSDPIPKAIVIIRVREQEPGIGTTAGADGKFTLRDVDPGTYTITVERDGYVSARGQTQTVQVQAGQTTSDIKWKLLRTGAISGRVLDPDGDPVFGVSIMLSSTLPTKRGRAAASYTQTNDRGEYRAFHIAPGEYRLSVTYRPGNGLVQVRMQPTEKSGAASGGDAYPTLYYPGTPDIRQATLVKVEPGADLQGFDLHLLRMHAVRVRGHVAPAAGTGPVPLFQMVNLAPVDSPAQSQEFLIRDSKREFEFQGVLPGKYHLEMQGSGVNEMSRISARQTIEVGETDIDGIELIPTQLRNVSGKVIAPPGRKLPPGLVVVLQSRELGDRQGGGFAQLSADGAFTMQRVSSGDYDLILASTINGDDDAYIDAIRMGDADALADGVHVGDAQPAPIEVVLKPNGGAVECTVEDDKSEPAAGAMVLLVPDMPKQRPAALFGECNTQADGTCKIS